MKSIPEEIIDAAAAEAYADIHHELVEYFGNAYHEVGCSNRGTLSDLNMPLAKGAVAIFRSLSTLLPQIEPSELATWLKELLVPKQSHASNDSPDEPVGIVNKWIREGWEEARRYFSLGFRSQFWEAPVNLSQPMYQNMIRPAVERALDEVCPGYTAEFLKRRAQARGNGAATGAGGQHTSLSELAKPPTAGEASADSCGTPKSAQFPNRASWLRLQLKERGWNKNDLYQQRGPDRKTIKKILDGRDVRDDVLEKVANALSAKGKKVSLLDIPQD